MKEKIKAILELLKENDDKTKQQILLECAAKIGSPEWAEAVKDFWKRMEDLNKK